MLTRATRREGGAVTSAVLSNMKTGQIIIATYDYCQVLDVTGPSDYLSYRQRYGPARYLVF